jgi:general secretion pathway protein K
MITVTLVASLAAAALWQQWRSVEVETAERVRVQSGWILTGTLDWVRLILREDGRSGGPDHLGEPWAVPLAEARLSSFLAAEKGVSTQDSVSQATREAFLSGQVFDAQARLNVLNLIQDHQPSAPVVLQFERLFTLLGLPEQHLNTLIRQLQLAQDTRPDNRLAGQAGLMPEQVQDLQWLGLPAATLATLAPYIGVLPARTPVNLNTAPAEVIYASVPDIDLASAQRLVNQRANQPLNHLGEAAAVLGVATSTLLSDHHAVASRFFEVHGVLRLDQVVIEERSLLQRDGQEVKTLWRERGPRPLALPTIQSRF